MKKLYYARTRDNDIFRSDGKKSAVIKNKINKLLKGEQSEAAMKLKSELEMHRMIKINTATSIKIFFANLLGPFFCFNWCCGISQKQVTKYKYLFKEG
jgi:hypothetical protein